MPSVSASVRNGGYSPGGITRYPLDRLFEEVAYLAHHFHWSRQEILTLEHPERTRWAREIARINTRLNEAST